MNDLGQLTQLASQSAQIATQAADLIARHTFLGVSFGEVLSSVLKINPTGPVGMVVNHTFMATSLKSIVDTASNIFSSIFK